MSARTGGSWAVMLIVAASACLVPATAGAQAGRTRVSYDVEFSTTGGRLDRNCAASGTDVLAGTLVGLEPPLPNEPNIYVGTLTRTTRISVCGSRTLPDGREVVCSINIAGNGFADVKLTIEEGQRDGWLQYLEPGGAWSQWLPPRPAGPVNSSVTGTCDPAEMAQLQNEYDGGQTAGSPNGQPIEVPGLPPAAYPDSFPARPPVSIWTLTVLRRRP